MLAFIAFDNLDLKCAKMTINCAEDILKIKQKST